MLGAATALYLVASPTARRYAQPMMVFSQTVPVFALAPLLTESYDESITGFCWLSEKSQRTTALVWQLVQFSRMKTRCGMTGGAPG